MLKLFEQLPVPVFEPAAVSEKDTLLQKTVSLGCTDLHLSAEEEGYSLSVRLDGLLQEEQNLSSDAGGRLLNQFKIAGRMNLSLQHLPQDGRFSSFIEGRQIDFRLSTHPTLWGEKLVVRILDQKRGLVSLEELGFSPHVIQSLTQILKRPDGLFVVAGPTGAGKTTTLYALLQKLRDPSLNIVTLEAPVEYRLQGIHQTDAQERGMTFAEGLRSLLRQDPDIILVGEIRDEETAQMALRAAMTGHRVLTTIHTQNAFGVFPRLQELKISTSLIADHVSGVLCQRLLRKASGTGRFAIGEILAVEDRIKAALRKDHSVEDLAQAAAQAGFRPLMTEAQRLMAAKKVTPQEVERVLGSV